MKTINKTGVDIDIDITVNTIATTRSVDISIFSREQL
jgi:hypothetical protein